MSVPRATMRLQFHRGFTFSDAVPRIGYFAALGISHIYASPIMAARPGSMHGYDSTDPTQINPELGGEEAFRRLVDELRKQGLGIIIDIVPNHMAIGDRNAWWMDVLRGGRTSRYAKYFDINWEPPDPQLRGKVLLPVLGRPYGEALSAGEITLKREEDIVSVRYFDHTFPLASSAAHVLKHASPDAFDPMSSNGRERLHELLEEQNYRLAWWRCANDEINWRRFFDINELAAIRVEVDEVFEAVHAKVFQLYAEGMIDGVRVDHVDGLAQPGSYCRKLRTRLRELEPGRPDDAPGGPAYFVVEKILSRDEVLRPTWETDGTTGYDFMDEVNALQHDAGGERILADSWERISGRPRDFDAEEDLARRQLLDRSFAAQRESAIRALYVSAQSELNTRDISWSAIRRCLTEILAHFPVYRIYARIGQASDDDLKFLSYAVERAKNSCLRGDVWLVELLGRWLAGEPIRRHNDALQNIALVRFQQLSAPLCAKAVEDTAFYRYGRLISRNDVGFDIRRFSISSADFHRKMQAREAAFPHSMLATATHDHKRGEDVRARLAVLSEPAMDWAQAMERWIDLSASYCVSSDGVTMPTAADRAMLFQTIVGAWPMTLAAGDAAGVAIYATRIAAWQQKALREAKLNTDWSDPNEVYECAAADFTAALFKNGSGLLNEIADFVARIAPAGAVNGLAQVLLKLTVPGVPDIYQGADYWDLSLVDPDNRTPVDFAVRQNSLQAQAITEVAETWRNGRIKQFVISRVLAMRKKMPALFSEGSYLPLVVVGPLRDHVVAFARHLNTSVAIIAVCRCPARLLGDDRLQIAESLWQDTHLIVAPQLQTTLRDGFIPEREVAMGAEVAVSQIFNGWPIAFLTTSTL